jgi:hypothetical protein
LVTSARDSDDGPEIRPDGRAVATEMMKTRGEWAEANWDVLAVVAAFLLAVAVSLALGVAFNVAAARLEAPTRTPPLQRLGPPHIPDTAPAPYAYLELSIDAGARSPRAAG